MKRILTGIICCIMFVVITGCNRLDKGKIDEFALSFASKYLSDETQMFNDACVRCYRPVWTVKYPVPKAEEFAIVSCTVSEWQEVKSYHYSISHTINSVSDVRHNPYGENLHGDGILGFKKVVYLTFVVEADKAGNLRVSTKPIWKTASGKSAEGCLDYSKQQIRKLTGRYP